MKNNKGFTLIELLTAIVILGIILGMAWPAIRKMQESNAFQKFDYYGEALISATKIYIDSYEEDYFCYDSDLEEGDNLSETCPNYNTSKDLECVTISLRDLLEKNLVKDINIDDMSCQSESTFVRVIKKDKKYKYKYYLGCGKKNDDNSISIELLLPDSDVEENKASDACSDAS